MDLRGGGGRWRQKVVLRQSAMSRFELKISGPIDYCGAVPDAGGLCMVVSVRKPRLGRQGRRSGIRPRTPYAVPDRTAQVVVSALPVGNFEASEDSSALPGVS